jgi:hypothetical protein
VPAISRAAVLDDDESRTRRRDERLEEKDDLNANANLKKKV